MKAWLTGALTVTLATTGAFAQGSESTPMEAKLQRSDGTQAVLSKWRGKPVILFYEDKDSTQLNGPLKEELFSRGKQHGLLEAAWVIAVANLEKFNFFPARQIALSYVRDEEKKVGVPILVDLEGTLGSEPWALPKKTSTVLLLDATGGVVYRYSGKLEAAERTAFFEALSKLVGKDLRAEPQP